MGGSRSSLALSFFLARGVKVHDPNDPKVGVVGGGAYAPAPHAPSPAAGHPYNPYCPVSWLPALGRSEHLLTKSCILAKLGHSFEFV